MANITKKTLFTTPVEIEVTKKGLIGDASKARRELGRTVRPIEETLQDAIVWFVQQGYIAERAVTAQMGGMDIFPV